MRLLVIEHLCANADLDGPQPASLLAEGRAMLTALLTDLAALPDVRVTTLWSERLPVPSLPAAVHVVRTSAPEDDLCHLLAGAGSYDAAYFIAPETGDLLASRCELARSLGYRVLNAGTDAIRLCTDKLRFAEFCRSKGVPTPPAVPWTPDSPPVPGVIKPRDGAGGWLTALIMDDDDLARFVECYRAEPRPPAMIYQPFYAGVPLSVAVFVTHRHQQAGPVGRQDLALLPEFAYHGGMIPAPITAAQAAAAQELALKACRAIPGLTGYVGVDLVLPLLPPHHPVVIEINPRLTTSYLGYRALTAHPLASILTHPETFPADLDWHPGPLRFTAEGTLYQ